LCTVLPCTKANDIPGLNSVQLVPSHRRELQTAVSTSVGLLSALANTGVGRIVLAPGTYVLNAELSITRSVVLEAAVAGSVVLDAQASSSSRRRVLYINPGSLGVVQLIGLNITGGNVQNLGNGYSSYGGGAYVGGGTVTFSSCTITGNIASVGGGVAVVGGTVAISLCTISGITASYGDVTAGLGGGVYVEGGTVAISSCTINGNTAGYGGGVYVGFGTVTITSSSITGNTAYGYYGGGVYVSHGDVTITSSSISGNRALYGTGFGGGVAVSSGTVAISSSTISGNTASNVRAHVQKFPSLSLENG
jgi:hypothetical protein